MLTGNFKRHREQRPRLLCRDPVNAGSRPLSRKPVSRMRLRLFRRSTAFSFRTPERQAPIPQLSVLRSPASDAQTVWLPTPVGPKARLLARSGGRPYNASLPCRRPEVTTLVPSGEAEIGSGRLRSLVLDDCGARHLPIWRGRLNRAVCHGGRRDRCLPARNLCRHTPRCRVEKYPLTLGQRHVQIGGVGQRTRKDLAAIEDSRRTRSVIAMSPRPSCWRPVRERASCHERLVSRSA